MIRNWNGNVVRSCSGPVVSLDANEVEVYAFLIGCCELEKIGGSCPIIEGDSFSAISEKANYLWWIADWVEEVQDISKKMGASLSHILREANSMADGLAREGISLSSIMFDL